MPKRSTPPPSTRSAGVLLHVTSLPSPFGIGDLGPSAYKWIDLLANAGIGWWQTLPLNQPDGSNSPYSAQTAFGGNVYLISPELLVRDGLLRRGDLPTKPLPGKNLSFPTVRPLKDRLLALAHERFAAGAAKPLRSAYAKFLRDESDWVDDLALFEALKTRLPDRPWTDWSKPLVRRNASAIREARRELADDIERLRFGQFLFYRQLEAMRDYARDRNVRILGDVPIYVSPDSADVWAAPHQFQLDADHRPKVVAGVPPDLFSKTGQRWGNPLYNWRAMEKEGFAWWVARIRAALRQADRVRIDHFRGLAGYWSIPASSPTAEEGRWVKAPGQALLDAICRELGEVPVVAEDLGVITPDVVELRDGFNLPGMQILQFAFGADENAALPHAHVRNSVIYTGTHDNDTTAGWFAKLKRAERDRVIRYVPEAAKDPVTALTRLAWGSVANDAFVPLQDVLGLGSEARMNLPGTAEGAWRWRLDERLLNRDLLARLGDLTKTYARSTR